MSRLAETAAFSCSTLLTVEAAKTLVGAFITRRLDCTGNSRTVTASHSQSAPTIGAERSRWFCNSSKAAARPQLFITFRVAPHCSANARLDLASRVRRTALWLHSQLASYCHLASLLSANLSLLHKSTTYELHGWKARESTSMLQLPTSLLRLIVRHMAAASIAKDLRKF